MKQYIFILLPLLLSSCASWRGAGRDTDTTAPRLTESREKQFLYYYYEAVRLRDGGRYDEALDLFRFCYAIDSLHAGLNTDLALLYASLEMNDESLAHLTRAVRLQPDNWWYNLHLIKLLTGLKQYDEAIRTAEALQRRYPYKEDVYYMLASLYTETRRPDRAIDAYNRLEKIVGVNEGISFDKFRLYMQYGRPKKGMAEIDRLIETYPAETRYRVLRGDICLQQQRPDEALAIYNQVLAEDPQNPYVYLSLSDYYTAQGQPERALEQIVSALHNERLDVDTKMGILGKYIERLLADQKKIDETEQLFRMLVGHYPLEEQVHAYYATFLQYQGRTEEMLAELETLLDINPRNEGAWLQQIEVFAGEQDFPRVVALADRGLQSLPEAVSLYFYKSMALVQLKDYDGALAASRAALALFAEGKADNRALQSNLYAQTGDIYYQLKDKAQAFAAYEEALKLNPGNLYTMNNYAYYLSLEGENLRRAERLSAKTVEAEPKNSTFLDTYAWILYKQKSYSLAKFYIERAIDHADPDEDNSVLYDHCGDILWANGEKERAREMWEKGGLKGLPNPSEGGASDSTESSEDETK